MREQYRVPVPKGMPKTRAADDMMQLAVNCVDQAIEEAAAAGEGEYESVGTDMKNMYFRPEGQRRNNEPPVYNKRRGDKR